MPIEGDGERRGEADRGQGGERESTKDGREEGDKRRE